MKTQPKVSSGHGEGHTGLHWLMIFYGGIHFLMYLSIF